MNTDVSHARGERNLINATLVRELGAKRGHKGWTLHVTHLCVDENDVVEIRVLRTNGTTMFLRIPHFAVSALRDALNMYLNSKEMLHE